MMFGSGRNDGKNNGAANDYAFSQQGYVMCKHCNGSGNFYSVAKTWAMGTLEPPSRPILERCKECKGDGAIKLSQNMFG